MRNVSLSRDIERIGSINNSVKFGIDTNNARAFKVLSSTLYKDKILACCREYSTNARDSHLMAGKGDEPFHVHLPNTLEPFFSVRDNGLGLSDDDVRTIWTNYFVSTKNDDVVSEKKRPTGTLGLGSKSGFAYVDSFTLISRYGGVKTTYTSFINEEGIPEIVTMGAPAPTDEGNGVEIIIPVDKPTDFREFKSRAEQVYELFDPMPIVTGVAPFVPPSRKTILSGAGWRLMEGNNGNYARAIMGSLAYPISRYSIQNVGENINRLLESPIDIDFELDSLDFTAGREELSYDQTITQPSLRARLSQVYTELTDLVKSEFAGCSTEYAARRKYTEYFDGGDRYNNTLRRIIGGTVKWRDKIISESAFTIAGKEFSKDFGIEHIYMVDVYSRRGSSADRRMRRNKIGSHTHQTFCVKTDDEMIPVILDMQTDYISRIRYHLSQNQKKHIQLISGSNEDIALFREKLEGCEFILASSLPKSPNTKPRQKTHIRRLGVNNFTKTSMSYEWMESDDIDLDEGGAYIVLSKGKVVGFDENIEFFNLLEKAKCAGLVKGHVFVLPPSLVKGVSTDPNWINIADLIRKQVETLLQNDPDVASALAAGSVIERMHSHKFYDFATGRFPEMFMAQIGNHPITVALEEFRHIVAVSKNTKLAHIVAIAKHFEINSKSTASRDIVSEFANFQVKYPLMFIVCDRNHHYNLLPLCEPVVDYINLVDSSSKYIAKVS